MFNWFKNLFKKPEIVIPTSTEVILTKEIQELWKLYDAQQALIKGLEFAIEQHQLRCDDLSIITASLLLNQGSEEHIITKDFVASVEESKVQIRWDINKENNLVVWLETPSQEDLGENEEQS